MVKLGRGICATLGFGTLICATAASAQDEPPPADSGDIVVTAQRRSSTVQNSPLAITAISGAELDGSQGSALESLQGRVLGDAQGVERLTLRGVSTENVQGGSIGGDPGVAFSLNGITIARPQGIPGELYDIDRVEALRGPQGTLYGRNATGGAVNVIARGPTPDLEGYVEGVAGNLGRARLRAAIGGPIADGLGFRLAGFAERRNGFVDNIVPGGDQDIGNLRHYGARGSLDFRLGELVKVRLFVDFYRRRNAIGAYFVPGSIRPGTVTPQETLGGVFAPGPRTIAADNPDTLDYRNLLTSGVQIDADLGFATLTSITGFHRSRTNSAYDADGSSAAYVDLLYRINNASQLSEEMRLSGRSGPLDWIIGGFAFRERANTDQNFYFQNFATGFISGGRVETNSLALFGQADLALAAKLKFTAGLRWTKDQKRGNEFLTFFTGSSTDLPKQTWRALTPRFALEYKPQSNILAYASATRGFKSGGFNIGAFQGPYQPETIWSYEAGIKTQLLDRRLTAHLTLFHQDYKDQQFTQILGLVAILTNAGASRSNGLELETSFRFSKSSSVGLAYSYLDAKFTRFVNQEDPFLELGLQDLSGNFLPRAPRHTLNVYADVGLGTLAGYRLQARADVNYTSRMYFSEFNRRSVSQGPVATENLSLRWDNDKIYGSLFVRNLTDERVLNNSTITAQILGYIPLVNLNLPRQFGAELGVRF